MHIFEIKNMKKIDMEKKYISGCRTPPLKGNAAYCFVFFYIDENDALSEYNEIPLSHNRTNGAVYSKIYFKVEICSAP